MNRERVYLLLERIEKAILLVQDHVSGVFKPEDFALTPSGMFTLSGVCMQLILSYMNIIVLTRRKFLM